MSRLSGQRDPRCAAAARLKRAAWLAALTLSAIGALAPAGSAAAPSPSLQVSEGGGAAFPARALVLSISDRRHLLPGQVHVSENGVPVQGAVVRSIADAGTRDFGVVLAIDASASMKGAPLTRAMSAARALAAQRTGNQEIGVVSFADRASVTLPLTDDPAAIAAALSSTPATGQGAYTYNALNLAVRQLAQAKVAAGAVILLSDGATSGGRSRGGHSLTAASVGAAASAAHARIYTVGLHDASYTPQRMDLLARVGKGALIESASSQLSGVFTRIESDLTSAYVVHYRSLAPLGRRVLVTVRVDGAANVGTLTYSTPPPPITSSVHKAPNRSFWVSTLASVLASAAAALLLALALVALLSPRLRRSGLRGRVREFTARAAVQRPAVALEESAASLPMLERLLERMRWWEPFKTNVEIARIERSPVELVMLTAVTSVVLAVLLGVALGTLAISLLVLLAGPLMLRSIVGFRLRKQRSLFTEQLPTHLQEVASAMRAGHSLVAGITAMAEEAPEPSQTEWARVIADEQLGQPLDTAMRPLARRMDSEDINQVALVAALHQRTGGNMAEVLERVADSVRERADLRRELASLTAQARLSRYVVTALPPALAGVITIVNPHYMEPLIETSTGVTLLVLATGLLVGASFVMRSIANIKV